MPTVAILNGGQARRFDGRDKSALVIEGQSILERQLEALDGLTDDVLLVGAGWPTGIAREDDGASLPVRLVPDRVANGGPLAGLDAALHAARHATVLLLACDMPHVTPALLRRLTTIGPESDAVVPRTERGYHPLCAGYTRNCGPAVERRLASGQRRMLDLLDELRVHPLDRAELDALGGDRLLANINTAAEYATLPQTHIS
jgi:molybdopterin-guanine dinucleotide biosynthesis protein A